MNTWRRGMIVAALLSAGCTQTIEDPSPASGPNGETPAPGTPGAGSGSGSGNGTGNGQGQGSGNGAGNGSGNGGGVSTPGGQGPAASPTQCAGVAPTSQIPRLTNFQYDRTIRDLLGVTALKASGNVAPSTLLATDQSGSLTDLGWSAYRSVAELIAAQVMADPASRAKFIECTPTGDGTECLRETIVKFGRRAFRRPMTEAEIASFEKVLAQRAEITATGSFEEVAEFILYVFLISPSFIQRAEITETPDGNGRYVLSNHEVASRLSYMLWGTIPDEELNLAADRGELSTSEQILAQAERMLRDPRAREMVAGFHRYYLELGANTRWDTVQKDTTRFPLFDRSLVPAMAAETERFFDYVVFDQGGTFQDLLLSPVAFVNAATAPLYGLDPAGFGTELQQVSLDPATRPGFLTRLGFLNAFAGSTRTSPILRGVFITKDVLGIDPGTPPPGALETPLPMSADLDTNRKQVEAQTASAACSGCHHTFINPPGYVMEAYDAVGKLQTHEARTGAPIDTVADVVLDGQNPVRVTDPADLMAKIAATPNAQRRYAQKWVAYAYARDGHPDDSCVVETLAARITAGGYTILNLITDLTQSQSFRTRVLEVEP